MGMGEGKGKKESQLVDPTSQRGDQAENRVLRVALDGHHVQGVQALAENGHDARSNSAQFRIL